MPTSTKAIISSEIRPRYPFKRSTVALPASLQPIIPSCAQPCIEAYIQEAFVPSVCSNATDFGCLCTHYSPSGFTIGEVSLACLDSRCSQPNPVVATQLYSACSAVSGAVIASHSVLTLFSSPATSSTNYVSHTTSQITTSTSRPAPTSATASQTIGTLNSIATQTPDTASTQTIESVSPASTPAPQTTVVIAPAGNTTTDNHGSMALTSAQAVGISVAAIGALLLAAGVIFCIACCRRKKSKKQNKARHSFDFVDQDIRQAPPGYSPCMFVHYGPRGAPGHSCAQTSDPTGQGNVHNFDSSLLHPQHQRLQADNRTRNAPIDHSLNHHRTTSNTDSYNALYSPSHRRSTSLESAGSDRTLSQLLPDKPAKDTEAIMQPARPISTATRGTVFEEDKTPGLPKRMSLPVPPSATYMPLTTYGRSEPRFANHYTHSPQEAQHPTLCLRIPSNRSKFARLSSPTLPDKHNHTETPGNLQHVQPNPLSSNPRSPRMSMPPNSAISYLPSYYTSDDSRTPVVPNISPKYSSQGARQNSPPPPLPRKGILKTARASQSSETSFESVDPEEPTPPTEVEKQLSPLAESSIAALRYPKVPRASNQAIPRSPPIMMSPSMPRTQQRVPERLETLLSKRRGNDTAEDLERRFRMGNLSRGASCKTMSSKDSMASNSTDPLPSHRQHHKAETPFRGKGKEVLGPLPRKQLSPPTNIAKSPEMTIASPLFGPKLTPSRRGDDLFISVALP